MEKIVKKTSPKNVLIIGGTGLLGYHAGKAFLQKNYKISVLALDKPSDNLFENNDVEYVLGDYSLMAKDDLLKLFAKHEYVLLACGADDRITPKAPALAFFRKHNVEQIETLIKIAKEAMVKKIVVLGSYFTHFNREFPELKMGEVHPYITSRVEQQQMALSENNENTQISVLELPYIFGTVPGRRPMWTVILDQINKYKTVFYTKGGTTMVTAKQVGQAIVGAFEHAPAGAHFVAGQNLLWTNWLKIVLKALNQETERLWLCHHGLLSWLCVQK